MPHISFVENLKLTGKSWKGIAPYISGYVLVFILFWFGIEIYGTVRNIMPGFTLFSFFPGWLRFVCLDLIASALIGIPFGIIVGFGISTANDSYQRNNIKYFIDDLEIKCIDCFKEIELDGSVCVSGQTDIICEKCGALMTITTEEDKIKKLILKEHGRYHY
ncbi:hypothetical protein [Ferroplasma acidiphilum]|uniref:hypothetical protein n=1 Tax=Ferroplasma acidiphilum TaxID=74969 RepID=UPI0023F3C9A0|nr:hypothetical protein [Ferroplasma acidiphilum]